MTAAGPTRADEALPSVSDSGHVELDWDRVFRGAGHGPMYALPASGPVAKSDGIVVSMDADRLQILPQGETSSGLTSMLLLLGLMMAGVTAWFAVMLLGEYRRGTADQAFVFIMLAAMLAFAAIAIASLGKAFGAPQVFPTLFDRARGRVVQLRGRRRLEADWSRLAPRVEVATVVNTGGAIQFYHLYLVEPADESAMILASAANNGQSDCLAYYEFLRRYMAGEWASLPETVCLERAPRPLLREFSANLWTQPTCYRPWPERSPLGKGLSSLALLAIALLWWPMLALTLFAARIGTAPRFAASDLGTGASAPAADAPILPVRPAPAMGAAEQGVYAAIALLSTAVWCWPGTGVLARIVGLVRGLP